MTVRGTNVNHPSYQQLEALNSERESLVQTLREQIHELELERDQALRGLELLTESLRRRGCCDHDTLEGSL